MSNKKSSPLKLEPISTALAVGNLISSGVQIFSGIQARRDEKKRLAELNKKIDDQIEQFKAMDFRLQNPYEDISVSTRGQELAQQQYSQNLGDTFETLKDIGGGAGTASLATAIARQGAAAAQKAQAVTEQRELDLQMKQSAAQSDIDQRTQQMNISRASTLLQSDMLRGQASELALAQANEQIMGGVGNALSSAAQFGLENPDLFKSTTADNVNNTAGGTAMFPQTSGSYKYNQESGQFEYVDESQPTGFSMDLVDKSKYPNLFGNG